MAATPKRKHSTMRKGKRMSRRQKALPALVVCNNCKRPKMPHLLCKYCGK